MKVIAFKDGKEWAQDVVKTTEASAKLLILPDRCEINADGSDLSFVTVTVADNDGLQVPHSQNLIDLRFPDPEK